MFFMLSFSHFLNGGGTLFKSSFMAPLSHCFTLFVCFTFVFILFYKSKIIHYYIKHLNFLYVKCIFLFNLFVKSVLANIGSNNNELQTNNITQITQNTPQIRNAIIKS